MLHALAVMLIGILCLAACGGTAMTMVPTGFPLNPCPVEGPDAIVPREGYRLVPPGEIVVAYEIWHNETPQSFACGAQSVLGGSTRIRAADFDSGFVPWVATYDRTLPLAAPEAQTPTARIFRVDAGQQVLVETQDPQDGPQFGALGTFLADRDAGTYLLQIRSASGETIAEATFEVVE